MAKTLNSDFAARGSSHRTELVLLRLAAIAIDVRGMLSPHEISEIPALKEALNALDDVFRERYRYSHKSDPEKD